MNCTPMQTCMLILTSLTHESVAKGYVTIYIALSYTCARWHTEAPASLSGCQNRTTHVHAHGNSPMYWLPRANQLHFKAYMYVHE